MCFCRIDSQEFIAIPSFFAVFLYWKLFSTLFHSITSNLIRHQKYWASLNFYPILCVCVMEFLHFFRLSKYSCQCSHVFMFVCVWNNLHMPNAFVCLNLTRETQFGIRQSSQSVRWPTSLASFARLSSFRHSKTFHPFYGFLFPLRLFLDGRIRFSSNGRKGLPLNKTILLRRLFRGFCLVLSSIKTTRKTVLICI